MGQGATQRITTQTAVSDCEKECDSDSSRHVSIVSRFKSNSAQDIKVVAIDREYRKSTFAQLRVSPAKVDEDIPEYEEGPVLLQLNHHTTLSQEGPSPVGKLSQMSKLSVFGRSNIWLRPPGQLKPIQEDYFIPIQSEDKDQIKTCDETQRKLNAIRMTNMAVYEGQWFKRKPNGKGTYIFPDESRYDGEWTNGHANGFGEYFDSEGGYYKGSFASNCISGKGTYQYADGGYYEGGWYMDKYHGHGVEVVPGQSKYIGKFILGKKEGQGIMKFENGESYEGSFSDDQFDGKGTFVLILFIKKWPDGRQYIGDWKHGMMHGTGMISWPNGKCYVGQYQKDRRHGLGTFQYPDGRKYIGYWQNGLQHGSGEFHDKGKVTKGVWVEGKISQTN